MAALVGPGKPQNPAPDQPHDAGALISALDMLSHLQGVIDVDAEIAHCTIDLAVPQENLHGAEILRLPVEQRRLGATQRVRAILSLISLHQRDPLLHHPRILPRR